MKILVPVKRVIDPYVRVRVKTDNSGVDLENIKMSMNPFCEIALSEAVSIRDSGRAEEVIAVSIGNASVQETLRIALAMGADRAIAIQTEAQDLESLQVAKLLAKLVEQEAIGLCMMGKQAIDNDNNHTGQMLAALLRVPQATFVSDIQIESNTLTATREVDSGLSTHTMPMPCVVTVDLRLNEPKYPTLPNIMKAKKKPLDVLTADTFSVDMTPRTKLLSVSPPPERQSGEFVDSAQVLLSKLKERGVI